ncbi:MAG: methyltransferase family protein [Candidatus Thorarchaeota archaeon]|jgi:protein-S-isoprenylcysteine O-methyltransferase Ste14
MIDTLTMRLIAGVLLISTFLLIYVVNFRGKKDEGPYETKTEVPFPSSIEAIGAIATFLVPIGAIILMLVVPATVYETGLNIYFPHFLVDTGPYARVRHPGYTGTFLVVLAVLLLLLNVLLIINLAAASGYFVYRAKMEEKLLSSQDGLGDQYLMYMKRTGMLFPRLRSATK